MAAVPPVVGLPQYGFGGRASYLHLVVPCLPPGVMACERLDSWAELQDMLSSMQVVFYQHGLEEEGEWPLVHLRQDEPAARLPPPPSPLLSCLEEVACHRHAANRP